MKLILLTILVGIVPVESSSDYKVKNDPCEYSEYNLQSFREIANSSLRSFLVSHLMWDEHDWVQSYRVKMNDDENPFYIFRVDRKKTSMFYCGVPTVDAEGNIMWKRCDEGKFEKYLKMCEALTPEPRDGPLSKFFPFFVPRAVANENAHKVTPPTSAPAPQNLTAQAFSPSPVVVPRAVANEKSTTQKGWLSGWSWILLAPRYIRIIY